ncbi:tetratricopeptide repeat protein [Sphingomonas radiodurans]|uniref:hypothetical protein n=1 Tax=Sphingomonas radiodurans TaxID=2890321 RepID=UPI001E5DB14F|nr:hypothetical protein [Sphingomonas radiodurans]WBH15107.1 hypothetical protein LLW23_09530 [Sphingomonas radiodurans]
MAKLRPIRRKRSGREWALRGALAITALWIGYISLTRTIAFAMYRSNPEQAYALAPRDGRVAARLVERLMTGNPNTGQRARATRLARQALYDEPLAGPALTALGLNTLLQGDVNRARQLFAHSDALSRRELGTQLWLIEDAVARNDIAGALRHYDIALRTARVGSDLLFPVLTLAVADPVIRKELTDTLAARPPWSLGFTSHLANSSINPEASADLFRRLSRRGVAVPPEAQSVVVNALVDRGALSEAWNYYQSFRSDVDRRRSRDPRFTANLETPSVFDWMPVMNETGVTATIQANRKGGLFDFAAASTVGGIVLQQLQLLPPGRYLLQGTSGGIEQTARDLPYWQLVCRDGRELGRVELPSSTENNGRFSGELSVSGACPAQLLRLVARPSSAIGGVTGQIQTVTLIPAAGG